MVKVKKVKRDGWDVYKCGKCGGAFHRKSEAEDCCKNRRKK